MKEFLITLNKNDEITSILPSKNPYFEYLNQPVHQIFLESSISQLNSFIQQLDDQQIITNFPINLVSNERCFLNGYKDKNIKFMMVLLTSASDHELLRKIMVLNATLLNEYSKLQKDSHLSEDDVYGKISKLNSELLNSKRIIEKQNAELMKYNNLLKQMSIEDSLTGCYNRRYFYDFMRGQILPYQSDELKHLVMIDFNQFKLINDQFGHDAGDRLLIQFVRIAKEHLHPFGEVFRIGGDEFILLINDKSIEQVEQIMMAIDNTFYKHSMISNLAYGIVPFKVSEVNHDFDLTNLMKKSDELMYQHKQHAQPLKTHTE